LNRIIAHLLKSRPADVACRAIGLNVALRAIRPRKIRFDRRIQF
jgi:hypothetical protein